MRLDLLKCQATAIVLSFGIKYSLCDLICDVFIVREPRVVKWLITRNR